MSDSGKIEDTKHSTAQWWFENLPPKRRYEIIEPHFEAAHPTNEQKKTAVKKFKERKQ